MQLTCLKRSRTTFGYLFSYFIKTQLALLTFENLQNVVSAISYIFLKCITICLKHKILPMHNLRQ